jgi:aspartate racemase
MTMRRVGILGGMGPEATVLLMQKIIDATPAQGDADHIPLIVDQNPQVPSRLRHLMDGRGDDPGPVLAEMARRLEQAGALALAMPCNTAHHYAQSIRTAVNIPLIDMVSLSVGHAATLVGPDRNLGILASPAVRRVGLFDGICKAAGLTPVYAADDDAMLANIRRIKSEGVTPAARVALITASSNVLDQGARVQMVACTEFSLVTDAAAPGVNAFDALDRLVAAIIAFSTNGGIGSGMP